MHDNKKTYDQPDTCEGVRIVHSHCNVCGLDDEWEELFSDYHDYDWNDMVTYPATCTSGVWKGWICKRCGFKLEGVETSTKKGHEGELIEHKPLGHDWKETVTTPATCTSEGSMSRVCARCGAKETSTVIPKTDHKWKTTVTRQATCQAAGEKTMTCTVCGTTKTETIPVGQHSYVENIINQPTCTETGLKEMICSVCRDKKVENIPLLPHSFVENVTKQATCTAEGTKEKRCSVCGLFTTEAIPKKAHDWQTNVTEEATCTKEGSKTLTCKVCGTTKTEAIPMANHKWKTTITKQPTETQNGTKQKVCTVCGTKKTEKIPATGSNDDSVITKPDGTVTAPDGASGNTNPAANNSELSFTLTADLQGIVAEPFAATITAEKKGCKHTEGYYYVNNGKSTHIKVCKTCGKEIKEKCTKSGKVYGNNATFNFCPLCGYTTGLDLAKNSIFTTYSYLVTNTENDSVLCNDVIAVTYVQCNFKYNKKPVEGFIVVSRMTKDTKESMKDIATPFQVSLENSTISLEGKTLKYIQTKKSKTSLVDASLTYTDGVPVLNVEHMGVYLIMADTAK